MRRNDRLMKVKIFLAALSMAGIFIVSTSNAEVAKSSTKYLSATPTLEFKDGKLTAILQKTGKVQYIYDGDYLRKIIDSTGLMTTITYTQSGQVDAVYYSDGRTNKADYDRYGVLVGFSSSTGKRLTLQQKNKEREGFAYATRVHLADKSHNYNNSINSIESLSDLLVPEVPADKSTTNILIAVNKWEDSIPPPIYTRLRRNR